MSDMPTYEVILTDAPGTEAKAVIGEGLAAYNTGHAGVDDRRDLSVLVKDTRTAEILGGIIGRTSLGLLFIDLVFIPNFLRGHGLGSRMFAYGRRGRAGSWLCQRGPLHHQLPGPEFYAKHGWHEFGRIACLPAGTSQVFMTKALV